MEKVIFVLGLLAALALGCTLQGCGVQASVFPVHQTKVQYRQDDGKSLACSLWSFENCKAREEEVGS